MATHPSIIELRAYFGTNPRLPPATRIAPGSVVTDSAKFVAGHLATLENPAVPRKTKRLFYLRLESFYYANHGTNH